MGIKNWNNYFTFFIFIVALHVNAQPIIKVKKEDNRFLFFQLGTKTDSIIKNKTDLFYIKLPDSLVNKINIETENGRFVKVNNANVYQLQAIGGMKYSHTINDTNFQILLNGASLGTHDKILVFIKNINTNKLILVNSFIVK